MSFSAFFAHYYDALNDGADYDGEYRLIEQVIPEGARRALDLGCGTGELALRLADRFQVTAVDLSAEMLSVADAKAFSAHSRIAFLQEDLRTLTVAQPCDLCLCMHDTLNYLLTEEDLTRALACVARATKAGGVFVFDLNTLERFTEEYAHSTVVLERRNLYCVWERNYHPRTKKCDHGFQLFARSSDGRYDRYEETQIQRYFPRELVEKLLCSVGFTMLEPLAETPQRLILAARRDD